MDCTYAKNVFQAISEHFGTRALHNITVGTSVCQYLDRWLQVHSMDFAYLYLPSFIPWAIQKQRNRFIFNGYTPTVYGALQQVEVLHHTFAVPVKKLKKRIIDLPPKIHYPCGFFDGATAKNKGGAGFSPHLSGSHSYLFSMGCGRCTNTKSELMA